MKTSFKIKGMHCSGCAIGIEMLLKSKGGIQDAKVDFNSERAELDFDSKKIQLPEIKKLVKDMGYKID